MNELIEIAQSIITFLETNGGNLNVESQQALGQLLQNILQVIEQQEPVEGMAPNVPQEPQLNASMPSSNVSEFGYDEDRGRLLVKFLGKYPNRNGPIYAYEGVPQNIFEIFRRGAIPARTDGQNRWGRWWRGKYPSMGAAIYHLIRAGGYPHQRLS